MGNASKVASLESDAANDGPIDLRQQDDLAWIVQMILNPSLFFVDCVWKLVGLNYEELGFLGDRSDVRQRRLGVA